VNCDGLTKKQIIENGKVTRTVRRLGEERKKDVKMKVYP
jgi:hypothetical protein